MSANLAKARRDGPVTSTLHSSSGSSHGSGPSKSNEPSQRSISPHVIVGSYPFRASNISRASASSAASTRKTHVAV